MIGHPCPLRTKEKSETRPAREKAAVEEAMKDEQKPIRIGKFNIVDVIAVILLLLVVCYGAYRLLSRDSGMPAETISITYVVRVEEAAAEMYDACQAHLPSTLMAKGALLDGKIESVEKTPFLVLGPDGEWYEDPDHVNLYFTCTANVVRDHALTTKIGEQEVRIGKTDYIMKSEYVEFQNGTVVSVEWDE